MASKYVVLQVPYAEQESAFLLDAVQAAIKAHRASRKENRRMEHDGAGGPKANRAHLLGGETKDLGATPNSGIDLLGTVSA